MAAIRRRFTPAEREQFTVGTTVEWLSSSRWKPGVVAGSPEPIAEYPDGRIQEVMPVTHTGESGFIRKGEIVKVYPRHVRLA